MDLLGPVAISKSGKGYILAITDSYSKLTRTIPMNNVASRLALAFLLKNCSCPYASLHSLRMGNGPQFIAHFFHYVCARSTPYPDYVLTSPVNRPDKALQ